MGLTYNTAAEAMASGYAFKVSNGWKLGYGHWDQGYDTAAEAMASGYAIKLNKGETTTGALRTLRPLRPWHLNMPSRSAMGHGWVMATGALDYVTAAEAMASGHAVKFNWWGSATGGMGKIRPLRP